jgi:hypothetical protein
MDVANAVADVWIRLGFTGSADAGIGGWVSVAQLYQYADEAAKKIAYKSGVFLELDTSITVTAATAVYEEPATHIYTLAAALAMTGVTAPQILRPAAVRELWALDATWSTTAGNATRFSMDAGSVGTITLYPNPLQGGTLNQIIEEYPATVALGASTLGVATVLQDYFSYSMLATARGKESDSRQAEMADHYAQRCQMYEAIIEHLFGAGQ